MFLTRLDIKNFQGIEELSLRLEDQSVLTAGESHGEKSASILLPMQRIIVGKINI